MGMGVAGKREDMVSSKASAGHPLMCEGEAILEGAVLGMVTGTGSLDVVHTLSCLNL